MSIFNWNKTKSETTNPTKQSPRRPKPIDQTDSLQVNLELTKGVFHNSYAGLKLAGSMCYTPIVVPLWLMGLPAPTSEDEIVQEILTKTVEEKATLLQQIHLQCHRDGTCWIYPHYSAVEQTVIWEFIRDDVISDIVKDINTGKIIKIITDEEITLSIDYDKTAIVKRRRTFSKTKVETKWLSGTSTLPSIVRDSAQRNVLNILPIPFANNRDGDEIRGHSDYERILADLKDYHDIDLKNSKMLAKFNVKMIQEVQDVDQWKDNNGLKNINDLDIENIDIIFNLIDKEKTTFAFPERAYQAYESALKNKFRKIVEGSGIPEILWGTKVEGNKASADQQMDTVVKLVENKRAQKTDSYLLLFEATVRLEMLAAMYQSEIDVKVGWNELDAISAETKSVIFKNYSQGVSFLINSAGATKDQLHKLWMGTYPNATDDDYEEFKKGLSEMAKHKQFQNTPYEIALDLNGAEDIDKDLND